MTSARDFKLRDHLALLDEWAAHDRLGRLLKPHRFSAFGASPLEIADRLLKIYARPRVKDSETVRPETLEAAIEATQPDLGPCGDTCPSIVFTQWIAGWLRHPYTEPPVTSAYVSYLPTHSQLDRLGLKLETLGLREVNEAGNVWLYLHDEEGIFMETQTVRGLPLATDAQIYLDLQRSWLRGPDQAAALREWDGFCRP